jgi:hypothetical protein
MLSVRAGRILRQHANQPALLEPAIRLTILAALGHGALLSLILLFTRN